MATSDRGEEHRSGREEAAAEGADSEGDATGLEAGGQGVEEDLDSDVLGEHHVDVEDPSQHLHLRPPQPVPRHARVRVLSVESLRLGGRGEREGGR